VQIVRTSAETPWIRDYGPLQVFDDGELTWLDFAYESTRLGDDIVPQTLAATTNVQVEALGPSFDGGGVVGNGGGLCVITDKSLAVAGVDAHDPSAVGWVSEHLGCPILAIIPGLEDEPTGHADMLAQFFAPDRVGVASLPADRFPDESAALDASARVLENAARQAGMNLNVVRVPMHIDSDGVYFSYLNGARVGRRFFVPSYVHVDPNLQAEAYSRLKLLLAGDPMVYVPSDAMAELGGAIHCVTLGLSLR
jgi:agmatine/peptidylarginine deiminase